MSDARATAAAISLPIEGMTCASCVGRVEAALAKVEGVDTVSVNLATERADIRLAGPVDRMALIQAVEGDRKSNRMSASMAHVWGVSGMHTGDCWVDFSKPVARDFSV